MKTHQPDYLLIILIFLILFIGLVFLNSASSVAGYKNFNDSYHYLKLQVLQGVLPGLLLFFLFSLLPIRLLERWAYLLFFVGFLLLLLVFIPGLGMKYREAQRWIDLGIFSFQPIEVFKFVFIIFLARFFSHREKDINNFYLSFLPFIFILILISLPIIFQPNIGSLVVIFLIAFSIYFLAGGGIFYILSLISLAFSSFLILIKVAPYRLARFISFISPTLDPQGISYHLQQSLIAIGSGGLFGRGLGNSGQKYFYLPEVFRDSIFAVIAEELGFILTTLLIFLFFLLIWRGLKIAQNSENSFLKLVAIGITSWIGFQAIINIGAMTGLLPLTGLPLPLISYGSSSLIMNLVALGVLVNISKVSH